MTKKDLFMRKRTKKEVAKNKLELEYQIYTIEMWIREHERMPMEYNQDQIKMLNARLTFLKNVLKTYDQETK
jgi:hypothetical protein